MTKHTINLSEETLTRIRALADQSGQSAEEFIVRAIEQYLEDLEDIHEAEQALREHQLSGAAAETLDAVSVRLGLDR